MRGQAADYDHWRQLGNAGWGWEDTLKYFKKSEGRILGGDEFHGTEGEWRVEEQRLSWEILDAFQEAAAQTGIPKIDDFNRGNNEGCGYFEVNQNRGVRWSAADAFLNPIKSRPNLKILTGAHVEKLRFDGAKVTAIEFLLNGMKSLASIGKEVILSSGAIGSPQILQLSGVGPGSILQTFGIPVVKGLSGVGENLQDHLQMRLVFRVKNTKTLNLRANSIFGRIGMGMEYFFFKRGPMTMAPSQLGGFAKSDAQKDTADLQYHIQPLSTEKLGDPLHPFEAFTASVCNLRPQSRGHVRIQSLDARIAPIIQPDYLKEPEDRKVAADAIKLTRRIVAAPAMQKFEPEEFKPGEQYSSDEELAREAGNIGTTIFHPVGTCKMGPQADGASVVNDRLKVHGLDGIRVVDASIMPTITSGNTNSPTLMIAEKASEMILEDSKS
tara:strand:- start:473 stop:1792 length:1320 start_codon:yes stop_codon:yes gene_type:complete